MLCLLLTPIALSALYCPMVWAFPPERHFADIFDSAAQDCTFAPAAADFDVQSFKGWIKNTSQTCSVLKVQPGTYAIPNVQRDDQLEMNRAQQQVKSLMDTLREKHHYDKAHVAGGPHLALTDELSNVEIDMTGVTLVMGQRSSTAVLVSSWVNVTLRGLTVEYKIHPTNQAIITGFADGGKSIEVVVPDGYPLSDWQDGKTFNCNIYMKGTRFLRVGGGDISAEAILPSKTGGSRGFKLAFSRDVGPDVQAISIGDTLGCRNAAFAFTFHVDGCKESTFANITLKGGPGFGFFHGHEASHDGSIDTSALGGNTFIGLALTYPDPPDGASELPVLSSSADAFHINGIPNGPSILGCLFEGHNDDGIAIHGSYSVVVDAQEDKIWVTSADYAIGDTLRLYDTGFQSAGEVKIVSVSPAHPQGKYKPPHNASKSMPNKHLLPEPQQWYQELQLKGTLPEHLGFDWVVFSEGHSSSGFELRDNVIRNHRARGMLIKASHGLIVGNTIANSSLGGIVITPELVWGEGDYVKNVTVANNSIESCCIGKQCYGGLALGAVNSSHEMADGPPYGHQKVSISGNIFANISQMNLWVSSAADVQITANIVDGPYQYAPVATCCPPYPFPKPAASPDHGVSFVSWATASSGLFVKGNCVKNLGGSGGTDLVFFNATGSVKDSDVVQGGFSKCPSEIATLV